jgi:hypothetical protein
MQKSSIYKLPSSKQCPFPPFILLMSFDSVYFNLKLFSVGHGTPKFWILKHFGFLDRDAHLAKSM